MTVYTTDVIAGIQLTGIALLHALGLCDKGLFHCAAALLAVAELIARTPSRP